MLTSQAGGGAPHRRRAAAYLKWQRGGDAGLQQLVHKGKMLRESDGKTVRDHSIGMEEEDLRVSSQPEPVVIHLIVGGTKYTTMLATLRKRPESLLAKMFDGLEHQYGAEGMMEGVAGGMSTVLVPNDADGSFVIDRNGSCFAYILDYLRSGDDVALPDAPQLIRQLAADARHFGFDELAARCTALLEGVVSLATLAAACVEMFTAADVCALSDAEVTKLLENQKVNLLLVKRTRAEVVAEREWVWLKAEVKTRSQRLAREAEAARLAAEAEAERERAEAERIRPEAEAQQAVAALGGALARMGADEVSEAGLIVLAVAGLTSWVLCARWMRPRRRRSGCRWKTCGGWARWCRRRSARKRSRSTTAARAWRGRAPPSATAPRMAPTGPRWAAWSSI